MTSHTSATRCLSRARGWVGCDSQRLASAADVSTRGLSLAWKAHAANLPCLEEWR